MLRQKHILTVESCASSMCISQYRERGRAPWYFFISHWSHVAVEAVMWGTLRRLEAATDAESGRLSWLTKSRIHI